MRKKNIRWQVLLLFVFICILIVLLLNGYNYLFLNLPYRSEILVVEGWLQEDALELAKKEFLSKGYKLILTTGFPYHDEFLMGSSGKMVFNVGETLETNSDSIYLISLLIRGTKAAGEYAHIKVYADTLELGENYTTRKKRILSYREKLAKPPLTISVEFNNDTYTRFHDRNLYIYSVSVNNHIFPVNTEKVIYYQRSNGVYYLRQHLSKSSSTHAANYLIKAGIPDSLVKAVETVNNKFKSKTYTSAIDIKNWLHENGYNNHRQSLTIFTKGMHARRSYISFKKAFGESADIGVIAIPDQEITRSNWWKKYKGWKMILYETVGVVYVSIIL